MGTIKYSECCNEPLVFLPSINTKKCSNCKEETIWNLKAGQKSVLIEGLIGEVTENVNDNEEKKEK